MISFFFFFIFYTYGKFLFTREPAYIVEDLKAASNREKEPVSILRVASTTLHSLMVLIPKITLSMHYAHPSEVLST